MSDPAARSGSSRAEPTGDWKPALRARLLALRLPPAREAEIIDELSQHLDDRCQERIAGGLAPDDAVRLTFAELETADLLAPRLAALRQAQTREPAASGAPARPFGGMGQDVVFAVRLFRRRLGVMSLAIAGLAMAIGLCTVIFTVVNAIAFRSTAVMNPDEVVRVDVFGENGRYREWSLADYLRLRETATLMRAEAWSQATAPPSVDFTTDWYERNFVHFVSRSFLQTFGATAEAGRLLEPEDDRETAPAVAVINYSFWARRFDRDPAIVGRILHFGDAAVRIVGVAAREFGGPTSLRDAPAAFWMPLSKRHIFGSGLENPPAVRVTVAARLKNVEGLSAAQDEASAIVGALVPDGPTTVRLRSVDSALSDESKLMAAFVLAVVAIVLLLGCTNVANLLLASSIARQAEIGARLALGASRARLIRQLLTESLLLGAVAGGLGLVLAAWTGPLLARIAWVPATIDLAPDLAVFGFVAGVSIVASLAAGLAPARHAASHDVLTALKRSHDSIGAAPQSTRLRNAFLGTQAAASILFLVIATLFARALVRNTVGDFGFDVDRIVAVTFLDAGKDDARATELRNLAIDRVSTLPGVEAASFADAMPFDGSFSPVQGERPDGGTYFVALQVSTDAAYFSTLGIRIGRGRTYSVEDVRTHAPVAVISEALARRYWPNEDPLGRTLAPLRSSMASIQVIGVTNDVVLRVRSWGVGVVFLPMSESGPGTRLLIRARNSAAMLLPAVQNALQPVQDTIRAGGKGPVLQARLVSSELDRQISPVRMMATVAGILGGFAILLAVIGLAGVTAFVVHQRSREIGVRLMLGATRSDILTLLLRQGLRPVVIGLCAGLVVALLGSGLLASMLYGIGPRDPIAIAAAIAILLASAGVAVVVPARRATRLDPARVLRES